MTPMATTQVLKNTIDILNGFPDDINVIGFNPSLVNIENGPYIQIYEGIERLSKDLQTCDYPESQEIFFMINGVRVIQLVYPGEKKPEIQK